MPLPTLLFLTFATGVAAALAGHAEFRSSPRPALLSRTFAAYASFVVLLLVPISVYFYIFHGDWYLLYLVDVERVPSAIALIGFMLQAVLGAAGFGVGAVLVRTQRETVGAGVVGLSVVAAVAVVLVARRRLSMVGTFSQFRGGFGLQPYGSGPLLKGTIVMGLLLSAGFSYLVVRLIWSRRRGG